MITPLDSRQAAKARGTRRRIRPGFDLVSAIRAVCADMVGRLAEFSHVDVDRIAIGVRRAVGGQPHGVYATLTPLRFAGGKTEQTFHGRRYRIEPVLDPSGVEYLYLLNVYAPRFLDLSLEAKLSTIVHELWHIGPQFDGDLRRFDGRCYAHGRSQRDYDAAMDCLAQQWLSRNPPEHLYDFLACSASELAAEHGGICGARYPVPKLAPASTKRQALPARHGSH